MTALLPHIAEIIKKRGPVSVADYMELALQHPEHGYYRKGDPLGLGGDFITSPEISQMFGEMVGLWCADVWRQMGKPAKFALVEFGPGRGTLMQDTLRATAKISGFHEAMNLFLLESSETLQATQHEKLAPHRPAYLADLAALPRLPMIVLANEFLDALPIRQFEKTFEGWAERKVGLDDEGDLAFVLQPLDPAGMFVIAEGFKDALPGTVYEISFAALTVMRDLARHIVAQGGAALIIDYGPVEPSGKPTLQAVSKHGYADVLAHPGDDDLTSHVDFAALKSTALAQEALVDGPIGQGEFLATLGIELRASQLKQNATPEQVKDIDAALRRLIDPAEMGTLFKALGISSPPYRELPGF
jgi:NADH dehydrogenase [ubiquinone] 1 alpha subcomplex assembly factor 7